MHSKLIRLRGAYVLENGVIASRGGTPLGLHVSPGGYMILDDADQVIGTLTLVGRVYDLDGALVTRLERHDLQTQPADRDLAYELGGTLGLY